MSTTSYPELLSQAEPQIIDSERAHRKALRTVDALMQKKSLSAAERKLLELQAKLIEDYEETLYPLPDVPPGAMLEHLLQARGMSQAELARQTEVARSTISEVIKGKRNLSTGNALRFAEFFHLQPSLFLNYKRA